jgi:hypothetical protein
MSFPLFPKLARNVLLLSTSLAFMGGAVSCRKAEAPAKATTPTAAAPAAATPAMAAPAAPAVLPAPAEVQKMLGRWLRSDGTYVLELRGADGSGVVQAAYFNPKSINVSQAIWMRSGDGLQVVVELNDVGYPGATYMLSHDVKTDTLVGKYNQPQMGQTFDIDFVRQAKQP